MDLYADVRHHEGGKWKRITPKGAKLARELDPAPISNDGPDALDPAEIASLLKGDSTAGQQPS